MCTVNNAYTLFASGLMDGSLLAENEKSFCKICKRFNVSPVSLDEILMRELGMSGQEILNYFQKVLNLSALPKHGNI